jgi:GMP synthase (glutamine-hydrolysing)
MRTLGRAPEWGNLKRRKQILLLKAGDAPEPVRLSHGDYHRWFDLALTSCGVSLHVVEAHRGETLPDPTEYDALIVTGSPLSVTQPAEWMRRAADLMRDAAERGVSVLGVCFGHQLLGLAYGSRVILNPKGREIGSVEVDLTPAGRSDPLFEGLPDRIWFQTTHEDVVEHPPDQASILASNANTQIQAMALGSSVRGVQFHPELAPDAMGATIRSRAPKLEAEAKHRGGPSGERVRSLLAGIRPTPAGRRLLQNFLKNFA